MRQELSTTTTRWIGVTVGAICVALVIHLVVPVVWTSMAGVRLRGAPNWISIRFALWFGWLVFGYAVAAIADIRFRHVRWFRTCPPLWLSAPLGVGLALAGHIGVPELSFPNDVAEALWPWRLLHVATALGAGVVAYSISRSNESPAPFLRAAHSAAPATRLDWPAIRAWAQSEEESGIDLLGHTAVSRRFAQALSSNDSVQRRAAAIVGPLGSGKSTILRWAASALTGTPGDPTAPRIWFSWISCWGIQDSRLLAAHVLRSVIATVAREVDVGIVRGIPEAYLRAIGSTKLGPVQSLLQRRDETDVLEDLSRIVGILGAVNARLVVVVEDADRAARADFDPGHLERIIWRLRDLPRVCCVLAMDPEKLDFDVSKLCEHIELLPPIDVESVRTVLSVLRAHCLEDYGFVRVKAAGVERDRLDLKQADDGGLLAYVRRHHERDVCDTIAALVETPRKLKHVVRRIDRVWTHLYGEVDIDDLIAVSVLKECSTSVFAFLLRNIDPIRENADQFNRAPEQAKAEWDQLVASDKLAAAAVRLVRALGFEQLGSHPLSSTEVPQGAQESEPTDYFRRILAEEIDAGEVRDQEVLSAMDQWLANESVEMISRLASGQKDDRYARIWEKFARRIPNERFPDVVDQLFKRIVADVSREGRSVRNTAFMACWREHYRRSVTALIGPATLNVMIATALRESLEFANDLYYFWTSTKNGPFTPVQRTEVRTALVAKARELFVGSGQLLRALRVDGEGWALRTLLLPADQDEPASVNRDPEGWRWISASVLAALGERPGIMARQVAALVGEVNQGLAEGTLTSTYTLNRDRCSAVFGPDVQTVLAELARAGSDSDDWLTQQAASAAQAWLDELRAPSGPGG
jgi:hypothetical protein